MEDAISRLPSHERRRLLSREGADLAQLARRRLAGEPLQYLEGTAAFADFEVMVDERVLIPRPETEGLYELATQLCDSPGVVVDLGTGSGVLAIALRRHFPAAQVHAVDVSEGALTLAKANARHNHVEVEFHLGDLFDALPGDVEGTVDLVVSNPPYVREADWPRLPDDVRHEPRRALVAGPKGTEVLEAIAATAPPWLAPAALIVCEIGETQAEAARRIFSALGDVTVHHDLSGRPRYAVVTHA